MGSSFCSPFLQPSLLSGRMTVKETIVLCLVLVGIIEADPLSMEMTQPTDVITADEGVETWNGMENDDDSKSNDSEDTTENREQVEDMVHGKRTKRSSPCPSRCTPCRRGSNCRRGCKCILID